jgi:hypothetical protein
VTVKPQELLNDARREGWEDLYDSPPLEPLAPKAIERPKDSVDAIDDASGFVVEHYLGDEFSDEEFTENLMYELQRRSEKFGRASGARKYWEALKSETDDILSMASWGLGAGVGGGTINYIKAGWGPGLEPSVEALVVYGGYVASSVFTMKGAVDLSTVYPDVKAAADSMEEMSKVYGEALKQVYTEGHGKDRVAVSHDPFFDSKKEGKYRLNEGTWTYDGPPTISDRISNLF